MTKTVYIYVGPHRSGSQFLLRTIIPHISNLYDVRECDVACNELVMQAMDEHPMFIDLDDYRRRLSDKIGSVAEDNVLFANEEFFGDYGKYISDGYYVSKPFYDNRQRVELLKSLFGEAKIIMTPRRQDLWVESAYMHFIHGFQTISFDDFFNPGIEKGGTSWFSTRSRKPSVDFRVLDWARYLRNYHDVFGRENVLVIPNEMMRHDLRKALERLYAFIGVEPYFPEPSAPVNASYSAVALKIALVLNRFTHTKTNRLGIIPTHPFGDAIQRMRNKKDNRFLWFLAGIARRISLHWLLGEVVSGIRYKRADLLGVERRQLILDHYRDANRRYAKMIGVDLGKYGYY